MQYVTKKHTKYTQRQRFGMCCRRRSRRCHRWGHSSVHWRRNCSADHTAMQTIGHSTTDITAVV